jgi:hypothetical protein
MTDTGAGTPLTAETALNTALNQWRALSNKDRQRSRWFEPIETGSDDEAILFRKCVGALKADAGEIE